MKFSEWISNRTRSITKRKKVKVTNPDHIAHPHWKKPPKKSRRLRLRARRREMQTLSRRRNRGH